MVPPWAAELKVTEKRLKPHLMAAFQAAGPAAVRARALFAVDVKAIQVGIAPTHGDLNGVMEVGDGVVAPQEQPVRTPV
jgi:hypothetical protein